MPPSGFDASARQGLLAHNRSNANALGREARADHTSLRARAEKELSDLLPIFEGNGNMVARGLIGPAVSFYTILIKEYESGMHPNDESAIQAALERLDLDAESIHIGDDGKLVFRAP